MGHHLYSFVRKQDYFADLSNMVNKLDSAAIENDVNRIIVSRNLGKLSKFVLFANEIELNFLVQNEKKLIEFMKQNDWHKGEVLIRDAISLVNTKNI